jgi:hypothetical protein
VRRAEQPHLLRAERHEHERARRPAGLDERARERDHRRRPRGIVVGAVMDRAEVVRRQRAFAAAPQMIVVRADDDGLAREARVAPGQAAHDVGRRAAPTQERHLEARVHAEREGARCQRAVDGGRQARDRLARAPQQRVGRGARDGGGHDAERLAEPAQGGEAVGRDPGMVHEQERAGPVLARVDQLVAALRVVVRVRTAERARRILPARLARERQHDLVADVDARVVVPAEIRRRDPVADEDDLARAQPVVRDRERREVGSDRERSRRVRGHRECRRRAEPDAGRDGKGLTKRAAVPRGLKAGVLKRASDVVGGALRARRSRLPAFHGVGGERADVIENRRGRRQLRRRRARAHGEAEREDRAQHSTRVAPRSHALDCIRT